MIQLASEELITNYFPGIKLLGFLRLDLPDPVAGGNKSYKLKYHLEIFRQTGCDYLLSFGGAWSNHIAALAYAGKIGSFQTIGVIRGDELNENSNPMLKFVAACGMKLEFISRENYRKKEDTSFVLDMIDRYGTVFFVPEGGAGEQGVIGCMEILDASCDPFDEIIVPVGTGATLAGLVRSAKAHQRLTGIAVLEGQGYLEDRVTEQLGEETPAAAWNLIHDFTLGGYANKSEELKNFISIMQQRFDLPLDHVYSGKSLFALHKMAAAGSFRGRNVLFVHTGGYAFAE
ncbi:MAG TPA: pyridoxal-phosphate dependent enzyme [Bacteroidia bacterium]|nr:pyridoxal-phosphate dependent enzyme [Bacteroidia bacterium]